MTRNPIVFGTFRVILILLAQTLIFSRLDLFQIANPLIYALFFYWYPSGAQQGIFLTLSFLFGLLLDIFLDTLAINAMVCITIALTRPLVQRFSFGPNQDLDTLSLSQTAFFQRYGYLFILVLLTHTLFTFIEIFSFSHILLILKKIIVNSGVGFLFCAVIASIFTQKK